jgi:hypothetical protein
MFAFKDTKKICDEGAWVHIKDGPRRAYLTGEDGTPDETKPVRIKVLGPDSPTLQFKARKRVAARIKKSGGSFDMGKMSQLEIEAFLEENSGAESENWADATVAWENIPDGSGGVVEFSPGKAEELYGQYPAIVRQLKDEAGEIDDFLALAEKS